jgi:hypothetical protein
MGRQNVKYDDSSEMSDGQTLQLLIRTSYVFTAVAIIGSALFHNGTSHQPRFG